MDKVELSCVLEDLRDVQVLRHLGIKGTVFFISAVYYGMQAGARHRVRTGEERDVPAAGNEPFGNIAGHGFPCTILLRRRSPGYWRENGHSFVGCCHAVSPSVHVPARSHRPALAWTAIERQKTLPLVPLRRATVAAVPEFAVVGQAAEDRKQESAERSAWVSGLSHCIDRLT